MVGLEQEWGQPEPESKPKRKRARRRPHEARKDIAKVAGQVDALLAVANPETQNDLANSRRLENLHGDKMRYCQQLKCWFIWDGRRWKPDTDGAAMRLAKDLPDFIWNEARQVDDKSARNFAAKSADANRIEAALKLTRSALPITPAEMDANGWLLNCPNGTLDLRTGELRPHRREDSITRLCPTEYDTDAKSKTWDDFLSSIFDGNEELIGYMQRFLGYCLTGDVSEQSLPIFYGSGANGKSTLLTAWMDMFGPDYAMKAVPDLLLAKRGNTHPTERADLFGMRFVACVETGENRRFDETMVKEMTGGDTIRARKMKKDFFEFRPTQKLIVCTNHKPRVDGGDHAIWRRLALVPFSVCFWNPSKDEIGPPELRMDPKMTEKLTADAPAILAWAVRGCLEWQRDGLNEPDAVRVATAEYKTGENVIESFMNEACVFDPNCRVKSGELFKEFKAWCELNSERAVTHRRFGEVVGTHFEKKKVNGYPHFYGIGLLAQGDVG